jgi:hypothetical protein
MWLCMHPVNPTAYERTAAWVQPKTTCDASAAVLHVEVCCLTACACPQAQANDGSAAGAGGDDEATRAAKRQKIPANMRPEVCEVQVQASRLVHIQVSRASLKCCGRGLAYSCSWAALHLLKLMFLFFLVQVPTT